MSKRIQKKTQHLKIDVDLVKTHPMMTRAIDRGTLYIEGKADNRVPVDKGNLKQQMFSRREGEGPDAVGKVGNSAKYARFVEEGTGIYGPKGRAYVVRAKKAKALAFPGSDGVLIFRKAVTIKGIKPKRFLADSLADFSKNINKVISI